MDSNIKQYEECIKKMSDELVEVLFKTEPDLLGKFKSLDADLYKILMKTGNAAMQKVGEKLSADLKKKSATMG
ncbi:MAG: hypothetical protein WCP39_06780 [Chlamydiota bacterium]